ncbi:unnamed protein product [Coregonus sp. 'balchen']|nr:unnamed protein product [Coregonus sp. 'balchen']
MNQCLFLPKALETGLFLNHRKPSPLKSTYRPLITTPPVALQLAGWRRRLYGLWSGLTVVLTVPHSKCDGNAEGMALKRIVLTLLALVGLVAIGDGGWLASPVDHHGVACLGFVNHG